MLRGIWLHGKGGSDIELDVLDLSIGDTVPVQCRALLIHPSSPERSYLKCEEHLIAGGVPAASNERSAGAIAAEGR